MNLNKPSPAALEINNIWQQLAQRQQLQTNPRLGKNKPRAMKPHTISELHSIKQCNGILCYFHESVLHFLAAPKASPGGHLTEFLCLPTLR